MPIRVLLADDDPLTRMALATTLNAAPDLEVVGEVGDGAEVPAAVTALRPDVVMMDLRMPRVDGIAATRAVMALPDPPQVLVLTTWDAGDAVVRSIRAGAAGYLLKTESPALLQEGPRRVAAGERFLSAHAQRVLVDRVLADTEEPERAAARRAMDALTPMEARVAALVAREYGNAEIALELHLGETTVKTHLASAQRKLGATSRVGVAVKAALAGAR